MVSDVHPGHTSRPDLRQCPNGQGLGPAAGRDPAPTAGSAPGGSGTGTGATPRPEEVWSRPRPRGWPKAPLWTVSPDRSRLSGRPRARRGFGHPGNPLFPIGIW